MNILIYTDKVGKQELKPLKPESLPKGKYQKAEEENLTLLFITRQSTKSPAIHFCNGLRGRSPRRFGRDRRCAASGRCLPSGWLVGTCPRASPLLGHAVLRGACRRRVWSCKWALDVVLVSVVRITGRPPLISSRSGHSGSRPKSKDWGKTSLFS